MKTITIVVPLLIAANTYGVFLGSQIMLSKNSVYVTRLSITVSSQKHSKLSLADVTLNTTLSRPNQLNPPAPLYIGIAANSLKDWNGRALLAAGEFFTIGAGVMNEDTAFATSATGYISIDFEELPSHKLLDKITLE